MTMLQKLNNNKIELELNIADFLAEYFDGKYEFSYSSFWNSVADDSLESTKVMVDYMPKDKGSFYYEYGLLKAEEEMEAKRLVTEKLISSIDGRKLWAYNIRYENPDEKPVSFYFYTRTRIMAFIQHENETLEVAWEMQEITQRKPILCLESHTTLFRGALDCILEAYSKDEYNEEELQREYCPDSNKVADIMKHWNFVYVHECEAHINVAGSNIGHAIDAAWTWFRTGYVNNFISLNPHTKEVNLNW